MALAQDVGGWAESATIPRGCSSGANNAILEGMKLEASAPTLEQLRRGHPWCWVVCEQCLHRRAVPLVPLIIRWRLTPRATCFDHRRAAPIAGGRARSCSNRAGRACTLASSRSRSEVVDEVERETVGRSRPRFNDSSTRDLGPVTSKPCSSAPGGRAHS
jgi:hypothetical protein